ncbi:methyltransferase domain-containing protein [Evansella halocellulosilytica]|uniref:methyltransferase domain-containing protein n=1 Tax=Evansella halocellulosilytica TaxID=2011013 RepID=UPI000BB802E4
MVKEANKNLSGTVGKVQFSLMVTQNFKEKQYDQVISRLAFHYLADLNEVFQRVHNTLEETEKSYLVFSILLYFHQ